MITRLATAILLSTTSPTMVVTSLEAQGIPPRPFVFMQEMEQILRELQSQIKDPKANTSSVDLVNRMKENSIAARKIPPPLISSLPEASREKETLAYRKLMDKLIAQEQTLLEALLSGHNDTAAAIIRSIAATRSEGHRRFRPKSPGAPPDSQKNNRRVPINKSQ